MPPETGNGGTQVTKQDLPDFAKPYGEALLKDLFGDPDAGTFLSGDSIGGTPLQYTGPREVPIDPATTQALDSIEARAQGGSPLIDSAVSNLQSTMAGNFLPGSASEFESAYLAPGDPNAYAGGLLDQIKDDVGLSVDANFARSGRTGGAGMNEAYGRGVTAAYAPYAYQAREAERNRQFQGGESAMDRYLQRLGDERKYQVGATALAPSMETARYYGDERLAGVGRQRENYAREQQAIDAAIADFEQMEPWHRARMAADFIYGFPGGTQTTTRTGGGGGGFNMGGALGGAGLGAGLGAMGAFGSIPAGATGLAAIGGPWGLGAAAGLGLLGGLFG